MFFLRFLEFLCVLHPPSIKFVVHLACQSSQPLIVNDYKLTPQDSALSRGNSESELGTVSAPVTSDCVLASDQHRGWRPRGSSRDGATNNSWTRWCCSNGHVQTRNERRSLRKARASWGTNDGFEEYQEWMDYYADQIFPDAFHYKTRWGKTRKRRKIISQVWMMISRQPATMSSWPTKAASLYCPLPKRGRMRYYS